MNQLDSDVQVSSAVRLPPAAGWPTADIQRLVVIILDVEGEVLLASRILELSRPHGVPVLLVGLAPDSTGEAELRRKLVTIAAFLREDRSRKGAQPSAAFAPVDVRIESGRAWLGGIKALLRPSDRLACYSEQTVGMLGRPLSDILSSSLAVPIYTFTGLRDQFQRRQNRLAQVASWLASLASIAGFFVLQARVVTTIQGWMQSAVLLALLAAEAGLIWLLNSLLGQS